MAAPEKMEFDQVAPPAQRQSAARAVASLSTDAADCAELLGMLGLTAEDGVGDRPVHKHTAA
jgi:hypothetical protein